MCHKSHRWELNPRPLGSQNPSEEGIRSRFALSRGVETAVAHPNTGRIGETNDSYTTTADVPRDTLRLFPSTPRGTLHLPSRAVRQGWRFAQVDCVVDPNDLPPRAA